MIHDDLAPEIFHSPWKYFTNPLNSLFETRELLFHDPKLSTFYKFNQNGTIFMGHQKSDPKGSQNVLIRIYISANLECSWTMCELIRP